MLYHLYLEYILPLAYFLLIGSAFLLAASFRVLKEYERGVIFSLGRFWKVKGPGLIFVIPGFQQMTRISLRTEVYGIPSQDVISKDNVSVYVNAVLYFKVIDPRRAVINVEDFFQATSEVAQTTLRSVLGRHDLDEMLSDRDKLNADIQLIIDGHTDQWGIKVSMVEIKKIDLPENMVRAIARQAVAERERRAEIIHAQGELQAAESISAAAAVLAQQPQALQLRYLQTLDQIAVDKSSTIVFPVPIDLLKGFLDNMQKPTQEIPSKGPADTANN